MKLNCFRRSFAFKLIHSNSFSKLNQLEYRFSIVNFSIAFVVCMFQFKENQYNKKWTYLLLEILYNFYLICMRNQENQPINRSRRNDFILIMKLKEMFSFILFLFAIWKHIYNIMLKICVPHLLYFFQNLKPKKCRAHFVGKSALCAHENWSYFDRWIVQLPNYEHNTRPMPVNYF